MMPFTQQREGMPVAEVSIGPEILTVQDWIDSVWSKGKKALQEEGEVITQTLFLGPGARTFWAYVTYPLMGPDRLQLLRHFIADRAREHRAIAYAILSEGWSGPEGVDRSKLPKSFQQPFDGRRESLLLHWETTAAPSRARAQVFDRIGNGFVRFRGEPLESDPRKSPYKGLLYSRP